MARPQRPLPTDEELQKYFPLVEEALRAFGSDVSYAVTILRNAHTIEGRRAAWERRKAGLPPLSEQKPKGQPRQSTYDYTPENVEAIRSARRECLTYREISEKFDVPFHVVTYACTNHKFGEPLKVNNRRSARSK